MRRCHDVLQTEQSVVGRGLGLEHVNAGARHLAALQRRDEIGLDDQAAARAVDDAHAVLHPRNRSRVDDATRLVGHRRVQGDEVGAGEKIIELDLLDAQFFGALVRQERVEGDDVHLQANAARGDDGTDIAAADHAQRLAGDLDAHEAVLFPFAGMGRGIGLRNLARQREDHGDGMLGGGDRVAERRVHDDDTAP